MCATCCAHLILLHLISLIIFATNYEVPHCEVLSVLLLLTLSSQHPVLTLSETVKLGYVTL
jgi:hypothetical protein